MKEEQEYLNDFEAASDFNCHQDILKMEVEMIQADNPDYETHHENIESNKIERRAIPNYFLEIYFVPIYFNYLFIFCTLLFIPTFSF